MKKYQIGFLIILIASLYVSCNREPSKPDSKSDTGNSQWIDPQKIQPGPIQHKTIPDEMIERIKVVQSIFAEVDSSSVEKWIDDFKRDMNPERELIIWEAMARTYTAYKEKHMISLEKRKELADILLVGCSPSIEDAIAHLDLNLFTKTEAREALEILKKEIEQIKTLTNSSIQIRQTKP